VHEDGPFCERVADCKTVKLAAFKRIVEIKTHGAWGPGTRFWKFAIVRQRQSVSRPSSGSFAISGGSTGAGVFDQFGSEQGFGKPVFEPVTEALFAEKLPRRSPKTRVGELYATKWEDSCDLYQCSHSHIRIWSTFIRPVLGRPHSGYATPHVTGSRPGRLAQEERHEVWLLA
jgi:hypothetical protein